MRVYSLRVYIMGVSVHLPISDFVTLSFFIGNVKFAIIKNGGLTYRDLFSSYGFRIWCRVHVCWGYHMHSRSVVHNPQTNQSQQNVLSCAGSVRDQARARWEYVECNNFWTQVCAKDGMRRQKHQHTSQTRLMQRTMNYLKGTIPRWLGMIPCRQGIIP